jgi:2-polyprenyl-3-methyl-5-hydroxy-6-metoxy-1,4-benzoquinol methylase
MAERWAEFNNDAPELPFFRKAIQRFGQPVLDVGCGTGRLLLPLLRAGIDIDGCDISAIWKRYGQIPRIKSSALGPVDTFPRQIEVL